MKHTLLITSVGSLVGQNIFDTLNGRRHSFHVIGLNTNENNPVIFRCDHVIKCPPADTPGFDSYLSSVIDQTQPDFVLPGRDADVGILAEIRRRRPELSGKLPVGTPELAGMMDDKSSSAAFASAHGLPFARTVDSREKNISVICASLGQLGYPMVAKPRNGFGSHGVKYILTEAQALQLLNRYPGLYVFQTLIDPPLGFHEYCEAYLRDLQAGIPAFFQLPDDRQYAGQCMISNDGSIGPVFCSRSLMVLGRCERSEAVDHSGMKKTIQDYASVLAESGWKGPLNVQGRMGPEGFTAIELNGRFSGSTSARSWMGYDEIRELYLAFRREDIGRIDHRPTYPMGPVHRVFTDMPLMNTDMEKLRTTGQWHINEH